MCGICGLVYKNRDRSVRPETIERMANSLAHRGPDDSGVYAHRNVGLGHRRLSIVDLAAGHQPLSNEDGTVWIAYNGEIYNHADLRPDLERRGHVYRTRSDTETVVHAFEEHGLDAMHHLRGMFAFAIYDQKRDALTLVRDRLGIKPLYYVDTPEFLAFASEIKALLQLDQVQPKLDYHALLQVLALKYTLDDSTLFSGIRKLEPGHFLRLERGEVTIGKYYDFADIEVDPSITEEDAIRRFQELFDESVRMRLMSDVPLGMFLSGGLDSTAIAARMAEMVDDRISTFSVAFHEREANELEYSRLVAEHIGADCHEITMDPDDFFRLWPKMVYQEDEPVAHPSSIALYVVSDLARRYVKVVLTGEGADELFAGYERYYQTLYNLRADSLLSALVPGAVRQAVFRPLIDALPYRFPYRNKAARTCLYLKGDLDTLFLDNYATFSRPRLPPIMAGSAWNGQDPGRVYDGFHRHFERPEHQSLLGRMLYADVKTYMLELLMKQDQMSMAASIESRVPFLDHPLVEFAFSLPDHLKLRKFDTKRVVRRAVAPHIPEAVLNRPKEGFPVPTRRWFQGEYHAPMRDLVLAPDSFCSEFLDRKQIQRYFTLHREGKMNCADQIWTLGNLEMWGQIFFAGKDPEDIEIRPS